MNFGKLLIQQKGGKMFALRRKEIHTENHSLFRVLWGNIYSNTTTLPPSCLFSCDLSKASDVQNSSQKYLNVQNRPSRWQMGICIFLYYVISLLYDGNFFLSRVFVVCICVLVYILIHFFHCTSISLHSDISNWFLPAAAEEKNPGYLYKPQIKVFILSRDKVDVVFHDKFPVWAEWRWLNPGS